MEVPVVATRVAGVPNLIHHEENGLLVKAGSTEELTQALARLVCNSGLRERFRREGRATVESRYSFAVRMNKIRAIYDSLLERHQRRPAQARGLSVAL